MGSFAMTCALSGLPIHRGDAVRFMVLMQVHEEYPANHYSLYYPRTLPLRGVYNDYGTIEKEEEGVIQRHLLKALDEDLIEQGTGDSPTLDPRVRKGMTFGEFLCDLIDGRLRVRNPWYTREFAYDSDPTIDAVMSLLPTGLRGTYLVDRHYDSVRVRYSGSEHKRAIGAARRALQGRYAVVTTAGSAGFGYTSELRVFMRPQWKDPDCISSVSLYEGLTLYQCLIREDVWTALASLNLTGALEDRAYRMPEERSVTEALLRTRSKPQDPEAACISYPLRKLANALDGWGCLVSVSEEALPGMIGVATHLDRMLSDPETSVEAVEALSPLILQYVRVLRSIRRLRLYWRPSFPIGPQISDWGDHLGWLVRLGSIAVKENIKQRQERGE